MARVKFIVTTDFIETNAGRIKGLGGCGYAVRYSPSAGLK
jgi:hypothetical protein